MFDIIGSAVFGTLIFIFPGVLTWFQTSWHEPARQVAMFHTLYNVATMLIFLPFVRQLTFMMQRLIPIRANGVDKIYEKKLIYLDEKTNPSPSIAVINARHELCRMGRIANENLELAIESFLEKDLEKAKKTLENESVVDYLAHNIAAKLIWINNMALSGYEALLIGKMFQIVSDIERIGDHAENIAEYAMRVENNGLKFSESAVEELKKLSAVTLTMVNKALDVYEHELESKLQEVNSLEQEVDKLADEFVDNHINRLKVANCDPNSGVIFTDMISDLERSADHANNIAFALRADKKGSRV